MIYHCYHPKVSRLERRERERAERRQAILTAARQLAESEGWEAVTTRRLSDRIEYSQPVLYSHFANRDAIVEAVALEGFSELSVVMHQGKSKARTPEAALRGTAKAYVDFAKANPALYDAMFTLATDLPFGRPDTPVQLHEAFDEIHKAVEPLAGSHDSETLTEVFWSSLHGLASLARAGRLRPDFHDKRMAILVDLLITGGG
jgi:AcrR family transcriptional regulator